MFSFKRLTLAAAITFGIVAQMKTAQAAECWLREPQEKMPVPAGEKLKEGGYMCVDHQGLYAQVESANGEREVMLPARGLPRSEVRPRIQNRSTWRMNELLNAGIAYPAPELKLTQEKQSEQPNTAGQPGI